jgi:hypothetical protein
MQSRPTSKKRKFFKVSKSLKNSIKNNNLQNSFIKVSSMYNKFFQEKDLYVSPFNANLPNDFYFTRENKLTMSNNSKKNSSSNSNSHPSQHSHPSQSKFTLNLNLHNSYQNRNHITTSNFDADAPNTIDIQNNLDNLNNFTYDKVPLRSQWNIEDEVNFLTVATIHQLCSGKIKITNLAPLVHSKTYKQFYSHFYRFKKVVEIFLKLFFSYFDSSQINSQDIMDYTLEELFNILKNNILEASFIKYIGDNTYDKKIMKYFQNIFSYSTFKPKFYITTRKKKAKKNLLKQICNNNENDFTPVNYLKGFVNKSNYGSRNGSYKSLKNGGGVDSNSLFKNGNGSNNLNNLHNLSNFGNLGKFEGISHFDNSGSLYNNFNSEDIEKENTANYGIGNLPDINPLRDTNIYMDGKNHTLTYVDNNEFSNKSYYGYSIKDIRFNMDETLYEKIKNSSGGRNLIIDDDYLSKFMISQFNMKSEPNSSVSNK